MITRRELLRGMILTAGGLLIPEPVRVFYSIPTIVKPKNLAGIFDRLLQEYYLPEIVKQINSPPILFHPQWDTTHRKLFTES